MRLLKITLGSSVMVWLGAAAVHAQAPAFPGALGFGAGATGGRNGTVVHVTNLNDSGPGSFRDAVSSGNRTVVFDVGGYISLSTAVLVQNNITIAGQTAPGGIGFKGGEISFANKSNIIVRFLRIRPGSETASTSDDALSFYRAQRIICDHLSLAFAPWNNIDGVSDDWQNHPVTDITVQNSIISNPTYQQFGAHTESVGSQWSWFYNIFANSHNRNPLAKINTVFINNLEYNNSAGYTTHTSTPFKHDIVNNYFIHGPASGSNLPWYQIDKNQSIYYAGNLNDANQDGALNGTLTTPYWYQGVGTVLTSPWSSLTPTTPTLSAEGAYRFTLSGAGAMQRDEMDALLISQIQTLGNGPTGTGAGTAGPDGALYTSQTQTGLGNNGYGTITGVAPATDTDGDGMPDYWEVALGSNPGVANPLTNTVTGYTLLENYLNWLAGPHAATQTNAAVTVALTNYTGGFSAAATFTLSNAVNGTVTLLNGNQARFTPAADFAGLGSFDFTVTEGGVNYTVTVSVLVTPQAPPTNGAVGVGAVIGLNVAPPTPPDNLVWRGDDVANVWNTSAANWFNGTNEVAFSSGDNVRFDDTGSRSPAINLAGTLVPGAVVFDAAANYTLGGSGALSGGVSLSKYGSGTLTVGTTNSSFAGTIDLAGGALTLLPGTSLGTGALTLRGGAFFNLATSGTIFPANPLNIPAGESGTITSGSLGNALLGAVTGDDTSVLNVGGSVSFGQASPQFTGFSGTVHIPAGNTLRFSGTSGSNGGGNTTFEVNGTLLLRNQGTSAQLGALTGSGLLGGEKPTGGTLTFIVGAKNLDSTFAGVIADKNGPTTNTALTKVGSGGLTLTGNSSHSGPTTVSAGRLIVDGTWPNSRVTVAGGATLGGTGVLGGGVGLLTGGGIAPGAAPGAAGTLTIGNGFGPTNATLYFDLSASPTGANDQISMNGGKLAMSGTQTYVFNLTDGTLGNGSYNLITGATDSSAWGGAAHNLPGGTRQTFSLVRPAAGSNPSFTRLDVVGNAASLVWDGSAGSSWDLTNTANWLSAGAPDTFYNLDLVRFDDNAANGNVTLAGTLYPGAITVSNAARSFTLGGDGALTGAGTLTKSGPGTLTLNTTNSTFTGAVNLTGGTTSLGNAASLGSGTVTLSGGAVLNLAGSLSYPGNPIHVPAAQNGTVTSSGGLGNGLSGPLTGAASSVLNLGNGVSFSGTTSAQFDSFAGTIQIQPGATLRFSSGSSGNTYGSLVPTFVINGTLQPRNAGNTIQLGALSGAGTIAGPQSNAGAGSTTYIIGGNDTDATFDGVISSNSAVAGSLVELSKVGNGTLTLNGASTYTGGTTVNAGTLRVNNAAGSGTGGGPLLIESGATLAGGGIIGSPTTLDEGATLAPGNSVGTLTFGDALDLNEASVLQFELGTARDQVVVNGALTLAGTLNVTAVGGFGAGTYTLFSYRPAAGLSLGAVAIGSAPAGYHYLLSTNTPGEVDLIVSLPTPPSFAAPTVSGSDLIFSGTGGTPGADYYVLTTTNLAGAWTPLATNQFDDSGRFSFTNTMSTGIAHQFFRLLVP